MEFESWTLQNGIRVVHKHIPGMVAHMGIIINAGSRDEQSEEHGLAHFIEHTIFKGTKKRKAYHIINMLENFGGELNAYTTKEETCIYASFLNQYYSKAADLFSDILTNSVFPHKELIKEKEVIIEEIRSYKDNPGELIFDDFEEIIYPNNPLGRGILGSEESLFGFTREHIFSFMKRNYNTDQMVISSVGNIPLKKIKKFTEKYFEQLTMSERAFKRKAYSGYAPVQKLEERNTYQSHCILGTLGFNYFDDRRLGLHLLVNLLGGPALNSRLNMVLREKKGYVYNVESNYIPYVDTGQVNIYFGTEKRNLEKSLNLVFKEIKKLQEIKLGTLQLDRAKRQIMGHIAISSENYENLMLTMAKSTLIYNRIDTIWDIAKKMDKIQAAEILDIANQVFDEKMMSRLIYL